MALTGFCECGHVNGDPQDNRPANLVICQDQSYHQLIHQWARALGRPVP